MSYEATSQSIGGVNANGTGSPSTMKWARAGKLRTGCLLWLLGVPIPLILLIFLIKGCMQ